MINTYLIAYDICNTRRLAKVAKLAYSHTLGGQKSVLEAPMSEEDLKEFVAKILQIIKDEDKVNIIPIQNKPLLFGRAKYIEYSDGIIIV